MAIANDLRKTLTDPTPLYFAAGTADLALRQAKKVPEFVEQLRAEAPARLAAVRQGGPKDMQEKAAARAKEIQDAVQATLSELLGSLDTDLKSLRDTDLKKLGESAQGLALRGVGVAFECAVKARERYEKVAEHGEQTVRTWRGEVPGEPGPGAGARPVAAAESARTARPRTIVVKDEPGAGAAARRTAGKPAAKRATAKKTAVRRAGAKKATPPAE